MRISIPNTIPRFAVVMAILGIVFFVAFLVYTQVQQRQFMPLSQKALTVASQEFETSMSSEQPLGHVEPERTNPDAAISLAPEEVEKETDEAGMTGDEEYAEAKRIMANINRLVAEHDRLWAEEIQPLLADHDDEMASYEPDEFGQYVQSRIDAGATLEEIQNNPELDRLLSKKYGMRTEAEWNALFKKWDEEHAQWEAEREAERSRRETDDL